MSQSDQYPFSVQVPHLLFLDANALFSDWQRALWLSFAETFAFVRLSHSALVLDECFRNLRRLGHLTEAGANVSRQLWEAHPAVGCISDFDAYLADVRTVHEKDRHVAAAALKWRHQVSQTAHENGVNQRPEQSAIALLTWNIRDFPKPALRRVGIERWSPDEWLRHCIREAPRQTLTILGNSLERAQAHRTQLADCLSDYQQRASGFPVSLSGWPDFLRRVGFRQSASALERANVPHPPSTG